MPVLKAVGRIVGFAVPVASAILFGMLLFGPWSFTSSGTLQCIAVEFPDTKLYVENPTPSDPDAYIGLKVVNQSQRLNTILLVGFVIECALALLAYQGSAGIKYPSVSKLLSLATFIWFFVLLHCLNDHFGRVCSGKYLSDASPFKEYVKAVFIIRIYIWVIAGSVAVCLFGLLAYACASTPYVPVVEAESQNHRD